MRYLIRYLTISLLAFPGILSAQYSEYSEWNLENKDSLYAQYNEVWEAWDYYRKSDNYSADQMAKYADLGEWCGYKITCYMDSVHVSYNLYEINGARFYRDINIIDPGFYQGYQGVVTLTERRTPTFEGFMQYKLERLNSFYILTPHIKILKKSKNE